jgi:hypothetical protein
MPPSNPPLKEQIVDAVVTALQGINGGSTYFNTVESGNVRRIGLAPQEAGTFPMLLVAPTRTKYEDPRTQVTGAVTGTMTIVVACFVHDQDGIGEAIENIIFDVHTALLADLQLGGLTTDIHASNDNVFYPSETGEQYGIANVMFDVNYRAQRSDLTAVAV